MNTFSTLHWLRPYPCYFHLFLFQRNFFFCRSYTKCMNVYVAFFPWISSYRMREGLEQHCDKFDTPALPTKTSDYIYFFRKNRKLPFCFSLLAWNGFEWKHRNTFGDGFYITIRVCVCMFTNDSWVAVNRRAWVKAKIAKSCIINT